jgi:hypothetical protein
MIQDDLCSPIYYRLLAYGAPSDDASLVADVNYLFRQVQLSLVTLDPHTDLVLHGLLA